MFDPAILNAIGKLAGYQAISIDEAFRLLVQGEGDPDLMPVRARRGLCHILSGFGYRERFVVPHGGDEGRLMWLRAAWPIDYDVRSRRNVEDCVFRPF